MFKIHKDAKKWAENLLTKESPFKTQFDVYYLCLIVGIGKSTSPAFESKDVTDIIPYYTDPYLPYRDVLAGLLLVFELKNAGMTISRDLVKRKLNGLLDVYNATGLSDDATQLMNQYAYGGFIEIREKLSKAPLPHDFLLWFHDEILTECFNEVD